MKTILTILALFILSGVVMAEPARIHCPGTSGAQTIAASGTATHYPITLDRNEGFFSVQAIGTFTGTLQIAYQVSNDGVTFSPAVSIVASATNGTVYPFPAASVNIFGKYIRIVLTETGTSDQIILTGLFLCLQ